MVGGGGREQQDALNFQRGTFSFGQTFVEVVYLNEVVNCLAIDVLVYFIDGERDIIISPISSQFLFLGCTDIFLRPR